MFVGVSVAGQYRRVATPLCTTGSGGSTDTCWNVRARFRPWLRYTGGFRVLAAEIDIIGVVSLSGDVAMHSHQPAEAAGQRPAPEPASCPLANCT